MAIQDEIRVGASVIANNGEVLGKVREVYPHFILVARDGDHNDLEIPVHSILSANPREVHTHVNRESATSVDDVETAHRLNEESQ